jgi:ribosomal protein S18 acetylase RimI-like enzyme
MFGADEDRDVSTVVDLQQEFYAAGGYPFDRGVAERAVRELVSDRSRGRLFIIEDQGKVVGYLAVTFGFTLEFGGRDAFIDELYVTPSARGQGLGTKALGLAEEACREDGIRAIHLEVEFKNESAKRLYAKHGYAEHTRYLMTKRLT